MKSAPIRRFFRLVSILLFLFPAAMLPAQEPRPARQPVRTRKITPGSSAARPRLVLLIVVDQFRYDYLTRFGDLFGSRGIGRLMSEGASWTEANFDHVPTFTAPGHAVFMTGAWPSQTGIIANEWYERDTGKKVKSITDESTLMLGGKPGD
jgi:predicted AlkP superfamily pyrophosphatase or phosphodiesterase